MDCFLLAYITTERKIKVEARLQVCILYFEDSDILTIALLFAMK